MSLVTDILDRLSGVAVLRAEFEQTAKRMDRLGDLVLNHEARLARIEGFIGPSPPKAPASRKRLSE